MNKFIFSVVSVLLLYLCSVIYMQHQFIAKFNSNRKNFLASHEIEIEKINRKRLYKTDAFFERNKAFLTECRDEFRAIAEGKVSETKILLDKMCEERKKNFGQKSYDLNLQEKMKDPEFMKDFFSSIPSPSQSLFENNHFKNSSNQPRKKENL